MKFKKFTAAILATTLLLSLFSGCSAGTAAEEDESATAVEVKAIAPDSISNEIVYAGQVEAQESLMVISKIAGKVKETYFDVGDRVNDGDILFRLDEKDIEDQIRTLSAQLNQTQQGVAAARNTLQSTTGGQYESQLLQLETSIENYKKQLETSQTSIDNARIGVESAQLALDNITTNYNNMKILYAAGTVSKTDFDQVEMSYNQSVFALEQAQNALSQAELAYAQTEYALAQAQESYDLAQGKIVDESVRAAEIGVSSAQASAQVIQVQLDIARDTLNDTAVRSSLTGVISAKNAKEGEYVSSAAPAYTIINIDTVKVNVKVSELIINMIQPGDEITLYITSLQEEPIIGRVETVSPSADATGTYPVTIAIDNPDGLIKPGMFAEVHFVKEHSENTFVLPINAVLETNGEKYVFISDNNVAKRVYVETGVSNGREIEIVSGLSNNDQVIVQGQTFVTEGEPLFIVTGAEEE